MGRARVTTHDEHVFPYYRSPQAIRNETFTHRMRGLDESEVREYLDLLAAQVESVEWERAEMVAEIERLRARNQQLTQQSPINQAPPPPPANAPGGPQAAAVLGRAQEVADQLVQDARRRAQEIVAAAQRQGREVVQQARVRTQDRMQALYDELDEDFHRLSERLRPPDGLPPGPRRYDR